jgi:hypothetical protein
MIVSRIGAMAGLLPWATTSVRAQTVMTEGSVPTIPSGEGASSPVLDGIPLIDEFGPVGTGDDTVTFTRWLRSGRPARLGAQMYNVAGPLIDDGAAGVIGFGVPGKTVVRRPPGLRAVNWVNLNAPRQWHFGIIWDMGGQSEGNGWGVVLGPQVSRARMEHCQFNNNRGGNLGTGLVVYGSPRRSDHLQIEIIDCVAAGNVIHGLWFTSVHDAIIARGEFHHNEGCGIRLNPFDSRPGKVPPVERVVVRGVLCHDNVGAGISAGSNDIGENGKHVYDIAGSFDAFDIMVEAVQTQNNGGYGISLDAPHSLVRDCTSTNDGGNIPSSSLAGVGAGGHGTRVINCHVKGLQTFGFDCGTTFGGAIENCSADGVRTAFNLGSFQNLSCRGLKVMNCGKALHCERVELANAEFGNQFNIVSKGLFINDLTVDLTHSDAANKPPQPIIVLVDNPEDIHIHNLRVIDPEHKASAATPLILAITNTFQIDAFEYNGSNRVVLIPRSGVLTVPDQAVAVVVGGKPVITVVQFWTQQQVGDGIAWWNVTVPARGLNAPPKVETTFSIANGSHHLEASEPLVETFAGATTGLMLGGGGRRHGRGYSAAAARLIPSDGIGTAGAAVAQIGVPLRKGAKLTISLPDGGSILGASTKPGGVVHLGEERGTWVVQNER